MNNADAMSDFLRLEGLEKRFGEVAVTRGVSLAAARGEIVALLGPSGSGKTTVLRLVAGFEAPDAGRIRVEGEDVTDLPPERRRFGMVFQHYALFPHMTVGENVAFGLRSRGAAAGVDGGAARAEAERDVLADRHVGKQRVVLEDHSEAAPLGGQAGDVLALDPDAPRVEDLEARDETQDGRLAAARRSEQGDDLAARGGQRHAPRDRGVAEALLETLEPQEVGHGARIIHETSKSDTAASRTRSVRR